MMRIRAYIVGLCILQCFAAMHLHAQRDNLNHATRLVSAGKTDSARILIDQVVLHGETKDSPYAWYLRGFIYKKLYREKEDYDRRSTFRTESVGSFMRSMELDSLKASNYEDCIDNLNYLSSRHYNDAVATMDTTSYPLAIENYKKYKEILLFIDPKMNLLKKDIEFYMALGVVYEKLYNANQKRSKYFDLARVMYKEVLLLDPQMETANYNLGLLYYNQGVNLIRETDYDVTIVTIDEIQTTSIILFKEALPFMLKAHELKPQRKETIIALLGIYFSLNESEKFELYKKKLEELDKRK